MNNALVTLEQAQAHVRADSDDDGTYLQALIYAASAAILNYVTRIDFLDSGGYVTYDSGGIPLGVPQPIQQATLILISNFYDFRGGKIETPESSSRTGSLILPPAVHFLLDPYRRPVLA